jgi:crossover junction endonuclease MUS81
MTSFELLIDNREQLLIKHIIDYTSGNLLFQQKNLLIGDIIYKSDIINTEIIIERKTLEDLHASIHDGRYREQKARLLNYKHTNKAIIIYLFEGDNYSSIDFTKDTFLSCIINTILRDSLFVYKTSDIFETTEFIIKLYTKLTTTENIENYLSNSSIIPNSYCENIKINKKDNVTSELCFINTLRQIPGCSFNIATEISKNYNSLTKLVLKYQSLNNEKEKEYLLENIKVNNRKIGKKLSSKIYNLLFIN